jgi:hypothetical protein
MSVVVGLGREGVEFARPGFGSLRKTTSAPPIQLFPLVQPKPKSNLGNISSNRRPAGPTSAPLIQSRSRVMRMQGVSRMQFRACSRPRVNIAKKSSLGFRAFRAFIPRSLVQANTTD